MHGGRSSSVCADRLAMSIDPAASARLKCRGRLTCCSHQLPITSENPIVAPGARDGPVPTSGGVLASSTVPAGSTIATVGPAGSRQALVPWFWTTMSDPRLPAAPPHGPPVTVRSEVTQAASAPLGDALGTDGLGVGAALGEADGLGLGVLPHAARSSAMTAATAAREVNRLRDAGAFAGLVKRLQSWAFAPTILLEPAESGRQCLVVSRMASCPRRPRVARHPARVASMRTPRSAAAAARAPRAVPARHAARRARAVAPPPRLQQDRREPRMRRAVVLHRGAA